MNAPSSTITAAGLAGMIVTLFWLIYGWLELGPAAPEAIVSFSTTLAAALVGYFTKETVYTMTRKEGQ